MTTASVTNDTNLLLASAKAKHASGEISDAQKIYRQIIASTPNDAEVIGLLALTVYQQRDIKQAKRLWRQALVLEASPWIFFRNLHNHLRVLLEENSKTEASKHLEGRFPDWPASRIPDADERNMLLTLADMLAYLNRNDLAEKLLKQTAEALPNDPSICFALGKVYMRISEYLKATEALEKTDDLIGPEISLPLLADLHTCFRHLGNSEGTEKLRQRIAAASPYYSAPKTPRQTTSILVLNDYPKISEKIESEAQIHFNGNYPTQLSGALAENFHFSSIIATDSAARKHKSPALPPDVIINNIANGERIVSANILNELSQFINQFQARVINHPELVAQTTRENCTKLISGINEVHVPQTKKFSKKNKRLNEQALEIEAAFSYPFITRTLTTQQGIGMTKVESNEMLLENLKNDLPDDFYVTSFFDSRSSSQLYRKIRAAFVGKDIFVVRVDYDTHWNVHGRKSNERVRFYRENPELLRWEKKICLNPELELGATAMRGLKEICNRIPLDIFGIDFDVASDGRVIFYEANATMNLLSTAPPEVDHPKQAELNLLAALRSYLKAN